MRIFQFHWNAEQNLTRTLATPAAGFHPYGIDGRYCDGFTPLSLSGCFAMELVSAT